MGGRSGSRDSVRHRPKLLSDLSLEFLTDEQIRTSLEYQEFPDVPIDSFVYRPQTAAFIWDFFLEESNYETLMNNLTKEEVQAFLIWSEGGLATTGRWEDWNRLSSLEQKLIRVYDKVLDQSTLQEGITLVRRTTPEILGFDKNESLSLDKLKNLKEYIITAKGNMSASAASQGLLIDSEPKDKPLELKIHIAGGPTANGVGMWIGDPAINTWGPNQREFMLNRDTCYVVGDSTYDESRDVYVTDVYYIGRTKHDYGHKKRGRKKKL